MSEAKGNFVIHMPDIGEGVAEVEVVEWLAGIGDVVEEDALIAEVMTDKATVEIPAPVDGVITWQAADVGEMLAVGAPFVRLQVEGEGNLDSVAADAPAEAPKEPAPKPAAEKPVEAAPAPKPSAAPIAPKPAAAPQAPIGAPRPEGEKPVAAPAVRKRAMDAGIDLAFVRGTGPAGRITHEDLDGFIAGNAANAVPMGRSSAGVPNTQVDEIKVIGLRRKIATRLQDAKRRIPHFAYVEEIDVTELEVLRAKLNKDRREDQPKLTMLPFIMKAIVNGIKVYPEMSSRYDDEANIVYQYGAAHLGIATQTDGGLIVPVVKHAEALDVWQSAAEVKRVSEAARTGKATTEDLNGSTLTITSLGALGGIVTTPVINSPEVAIIGINKMVKRPMWDGSDFVPRDVMNMSSCFDHRIIDGYVAAQFIQLIRKQLETPALLFMDN